MKHKTKLATPGKCTRRKSTFRVMPLKADNKKLMVEAKTVTFTACNDTLTTSYINTTIVHPGLNNVSLGKLNHEERTPEIQV